MRRVISRYIFILFACVAGAVSCQDIYLDEYDTLALDYTKINVNREGGQFAFMVYYSGDWTIELDREVAWAQLEKTSGTGITPVHIDVEENFTFRRAFNMVVAAGESRDTVVVTQLPAVDKPFFSFAEQGVSLANGSGRVSVVMKSNLAQQAIISQTPAVEYVQGTDWLGNFGFESAADGYEVDNGVAVYTYRMMFDVKDNDSGQERTAYISYVLYDEDGNSYGCDIPVTQGTQPGEIIIRNSVIRGSAQREYSEAITGGLERYADKIACNVAYIGEADFITDAHVKDGRLYYTLLENTGTGSREADITVAYGDNISASTLRIVQREAGVNAIHEIGTAKDLLDWNNDYANWAADDLVLLKNDIDCSGVINSENWTLRTFKGTFDGNGKTIDNLVIEKAGEAAFFAKVESGRVSSLTFGPGCSFTATAATSGKRIYAASLAAVASGTATFINVVNKGAVSASETAAGGTNGNYIAGICSSYGSTGAVTGCENHGPVTFRANPEAWVNCGGLFGEVTRQTVLTGCVNYGYIRFVGTNTNSKTLNVAGITAGANIAAFDSCVNHGKIESNVSGTNKSEVNVGGIVAIDNAGVLGEIRGCVNEGDLTNNSQANNLRMGGFIGCIKGHPTDVAGFTNNGDIVNSGAVSSWMAAGGAVGLVLDLKAESNTISDCENNGLVHNTVAKGRVSLGGIVGFIQNSCTEVSGSTNTAEVKNTGAASSGVTLGGVVGRIEAIDNGTNAIRDCDNEGDVTFEADAANDANMKSGLGGILGVQSGAIYDGADKKKYHKSSEIMIENCSNSGKVEKSGKGNSNLYMGGVAAAFNSLLETDRTYVQKGSLVSCSNTGSLVDSSTGTAAVSGELIGYSGDVVVTYQN